MVVTCPPMIGPDNELSNFITIIIKDDHWPRRNTTLNKSFCCCVNRKYIHHADYLNIRFIRWNEYKGEVIVIYPAQGLNWIKVLRKREVAPCLAPETYLWTKTTKIIASPTSAVQDHPMLSSSFPWEELLNGKKAWFLWASRVDFNLGFWPQTRGVSSIVNSCSRG